MRSRVRQWARRVRERGIRVRTLVLVLLALTALAALALLDTIWSMRLMLRVDVAAGGGTGAAEAVLALTGREAGLSVALVGLAAATAAVSIRLVLAPLAEAVERISAGEKVSMKGLYELRYLARAYNTMYAEKKKESERLLYQAEHDPLTKLFNRGAFDKLRAAHQDENIGLMLIDVDYFKDVNDTYGHDTGDLVLQKVARLLSGNFRSTDYPCRVGGDEFSIIISDLTPSVLDVKAVIERKIRSIGGALQDTSDGLPAVTLSIGVAFGEQCLPGDDIYKLADEALYKVKERGRNGYAFYGM